MDGKSICPDKPRKRELFIKKSPTSTLMAKIQTSPEIPFQKADELNRLETKIDKKDNHFTPNAKGDRIKLENKRDLHVISNPSLRRQSHKQKPNNMSLQTEETNYTANPVQKKRDQLTEKMIENKNFKIGILKRELKESRDQVQELQKLSKNSISLHFEKLETVIVSPKNSLVNKETKQVYTAKSKEPIDSDRLNIQISELINNSTNPEIEINLRGENNELLSKLEAQNTYVTNLISRLHQLSIDNQFLKDTLEQYAKFVDESDLSKLPSVLDKLDLKISSVADKLTAKQDLLTVATPLSSSAQLSLENTISSENYEKMKIKEKMLLATIENKSSQIEALFDENKNLKLELSVFSSNLDTNELLKTNMALTKDNEKMLKQIYEYESERIPAIRSNFIQKIEINLDSIKKLKKDIKSFKQMCRSKDKDIEVLKNALNSIEYPTISEESIVLKKFEHLGVEWVFISQENRGFWIEKHRIKHELTEILEQSFAKDSELFAAINREKDTLRSIVENIKDAIASNKPIHHINELIKQIESIQNQSFDDSCDFDDRDLRILMKDYKKLQKQVNSFSSMIEARDEVIHAQSLTISSIKEEISDIKDRLTFILESYRRTKNQELMQLLGFIRKILNTT